MIKKKIGDLGDDFFKENDNYEKIEEVVEEEKF